MKPFHWRLTNGIGWPWVATRPPAITTSTASTAVAPPRPRTCAGLSLGSLTRRSPQASRVPSTNATTVLEGARSFAVAVRLDAKFRESIDAVREPKPLGRLPNAERQPWQKLWAEVKAALAEARKSPRAPERLPPPQTEA